MVGPPVQAITLLLLAEPQATIIASGDTLLTEFNFAFCADLVRSKFQREFASLTECPLLDGAACATANATYNAATLCAKPQDVRR